MNHPLYHKVLKFLREGDIQRQKLLIGLSGGRDSVTLFHLLSEMSRPLQLHLLAAYVHHGPANSPKAAAYRTQAAAFVKNLCSKKSVPFYLAKSDKTLSNEKQMRDFRHSALRFLRLKHKAHWIVLGHNSEDVLETRLIHLIRGSSEAGLKGMGFNRPPLLRPLVLSSREDIADYSEKHKLKYLDDPSNQETTPLRNWLRHTWLPLLEEKRPKALATLSRSLSLIAETAVLPDNEFKDYVSQKGINRQRLLELGPLHQARLFAFYMRTKGFLAYSLSHVQELQKHNQRREKIFKLRLLKRTWHFSPEWIFLDEEV